MQSPVIVGATRRDRIADRHNGGGRPAVDAVRGHWAGAQVVDAARNASIVPNRPGRPVPSFFRKREMQAIKRKSHASRRRLLRPRKMRRLPEARRCVEPSSFRHHAD
jgi:hypothetical protein